MVPSILVSTARGSKLVIGGAGGELIISAVAQVSLGTPGWNAPLLGGPAVPRGVGEGGWYPHSPAFLPASSSSLQAIMNKLWLGFDLQAAINAPILHVDSKGQVEFEPSFSQEVQKGLQDRGQEQNKRPFFLNVVQAVSQDGACVHAAADPRKGGEPSGY